MSAKQTLTLLSMKVHTCVKRVRVVIFAGWPEACQTIIRDFQNEPTVHDAIGWLEVPVAADVAVVKIVHSLVERRPLNHFFFLFFFILFCLPSKAGNRTILKRIMELTWFDKQVHAAGKEAAFQGRHSHGRIAVKLCLIPFAGIRNVVQKL